MLIAAAIAVALAALALPSLSGSGQEAALGALLLLGLVPAVLAQRERARRLALEAENLAGARFRDFAQVASDWLWETDADFRFTYVSENVEENLGYPA
ncbi:MAG TPA: PAS domain-containing protein, partial [Stellaceae bacterium]|nr:PAS domain-containing protein [Stellaceae bacterium]